MRTQPNLSRLATSLLALALSLAYVPQVAAQAPYELHPDARRCYQLRQSDPEAAAQLAAERLAGGGLAPPDELVFEACRAVSRALMGDRDAALAGVEAVEALLASHPMPTGFELRALSNAGATLQLAGDITGALNMHERALRAAAREDAWEAQVVSLVNIALLHGEELAAYQQAENLFAQAAEIDDAHGSGKAIVSYNRGLNYLRMDRRDDAHAQFALALAAARSANERMLLDRAQAELLALDAGPGARAGLRRLIGQQRKAGDVSGAARSALLQAQLALDAGDAGLAIEDVDRALSLLPDSTFQTERRDAHALRTAALAAQGRWREAYQANARMHDEQLDRLRTNQLASMARIQATLVDEHNRDELALARQQREVSALQATHERRQRNLAFGALAVLVLLAIGFFAYQRRVTRRLRRLSTRDSLTKLLNRHAAGKRLNAMVPVRVDAGDARAVIFLIDIDGFKAINDRHGHDAGDAALITVARTLVAACGPDAVVARWGGEEFLVGERGLDRAGAGQTADRLRRAISGATVGGGVGTVTVSIGFAAAPVFPAPGSAASGAAAGHWPDAVILADRALYAAKRGGRDTWVGLWGRAGAPAAIDDVLEEPGAAIADGDVLLSAGRPGFAWPRADAG
ncbi:GGDEF domain-containing protein [Luteimonas saliphila]|uniref:GGDEF domain-containing protein n=1 Tax=Luteimonas saliphila TaxID=2804919 RepID=UPI00192E1FCE|nr:GGDEF domain-containing protein [Luteimonas saliphila]